MEFVKQYVVLYKKAKTDLHVAKILLDDFEKGDNELDLEVIMFHLQQCAEKLLKALLAFHGHHFTKTHSIETLVDALTSSHSVILKGIEELIPLSDYAVEGRYAMIHDDLDDVGKYLKILDELSHCVHIEIQ